MSIPNKIAVDVLLSGLLLIPALLVATIVNASRSDCISCGSTIAITVWIASVLALQPVYWASRIPRLKRLTIWLFSLIAGLFLYVLLEILAGVTLAAGEITNALAFGFSANLVGELSALAFSIIGVQRALNSQAQVPDRSPLSKSIPQEANDSVDGWWRRRSKEFRLWCFGSTAWATAVLLFVVGLDPFNNGSWDYMDDDEYFQMFFWMLVPPLFIGIARYSYEKWIK